MQANTAFVLSPPPPPFLLSHQGVARPMPTAWPRAWTCPYLSPPSPRNIPYRFMLACPSKPLQYPTMYTVFTPLTCILFHCACASPLFPPRPNKNRVLLAPCPLVLRWTVWPRRWTCPSLRHPLAGSSLATLWTLASAPCAERRASAQVCGPVCMCDMQGCSGSPYCTHATCVFVLQRCAVGCKLWLPS